MSLGKRIYFNRQELNEVCQIERVNMIEDRLLKAGLAAAELLFEGIEGMRIYNNPVFDNDPHRVSAVNFERFKESAEKGDVGGLYYDVHYPLWGFNYMRFQLPAILAYDETKYEPAYATIRPNEIDHYVHIVSNDSEPALKSIIFLA